MSIISRMRKQSAVYWALKSAESGGIAYDDYGQPQWTSSVVIDCRWEDVAEEFIASDGTRQLSRSVVYTSEDIDVGGVLMLGDADDVTDEDNPKENEGAWEIRRFEKLPTFKATEFLRTVYL